MFELKSNCIFIIIHFNNYLDPQKWTRKKLMAFALLSDISFRAILTAFVFQVIFQKIKLIVKNGDFDTTDLTLLQTR